MRRLWASWGEQMGTLWAWLGVGMVTIGLDILLIVVAIRYRRGRAFSILGGVVLMLATIILLACYLPVVILPDVAAQSAVFNQPAPVDASATIFYVSPRDAESPQLGSDTLFAVAARTGTIRWQRTLPTYTSRLTAYEPPRYVEAGGVAYVTTQAAQGITVGAYRAADGALLWQTTVPEGIASAPFAATSNAVYLPIGVLQQYLTQGIVALRASDGAQLWRIEIGTSDDSGGTLIATPDVVYLSKVSSMQAYRASDGKPLWRQAQQMWRSSLLPVAGESVAYLLGTGGTFSAVRASDGTVICSGAGGNSEVHLLALGGGMLYLTAQGLGNIGDAQGRLINPETVYAYDATTCALRWTYATASGNEARGLIAEDGAVYVFADDGIHALRAADGTVLWHRAAVNVYSPGAGWGLAARPAMLGNTLYVTSVVPLGGIQFSKALRGRMHLFAIGPHGSDYWQIPIGQVNIYQ